LPSFSALATELVFEVHLVCRTIIPNVNSLGHARNASLARASTSDHVRSRGTLPVRKLGCERDLHATETLVSPLKTPVAQPMHRQNERVLVLTQYYAPEPNFITYDVAHGLAEHARVTVITAFPNYPLGQFYDRRSHWLPRKEREGNVTVWRVPMYPDHSRSRMGRFLSYLSFTAAAAVLAPLVAGIPRVVWVYQTPFSVGFVALWFKLVYRAKVVFTYADLWPESFLAAAVSRPGRLVDFLFSLRKFINRFADIIIGSTRGTVQRFVDDGVPPALLHYVPVWVQGISDAPTSVSTPPDRIVYAGNLGAGQHLEPVIAAAAELERRGTPVEFDLYGSGLEEQQLRELAKKLGARNVHFRGRVAPEVAFAASSQALAQLVTLKADPMFAMTIPSKLPFCFAAGAPILYALEGEPAHVAEASGAAFRFDGNDPATLVARIEEILALTESQRLHLRHRLQRYYTSEFSRDMLLQRYSAVVLGQHTGKQYDHALDCG
jgi:colanic acid biosynthesis glycosyl transferase WcaI